MHFVRKSVKSLAALVLSMSFTLCGAGCQGPEAGSALGKSGIGDQQVQTARMNSDLRTDR